MFNAESEGSSRKVVDISGYGVALSRASSVVRAHFPAMSRKVEIEVLKVSVDPFAVV